MRLFLAMSGMFGGAAVAAPCPVKVSPAKGVEARDWAAVHQIARPGEPVPKGEDALTQAICGGEEHCAQYAELSVLDDDLGLTVALQTKDRAYRVFKDLDQKPPHATWVYTRPLGDELMHLSFRYEELGRTPYCETPEDEAKGDCTSATTLEGHFYADFVFDLRADTVLFSQSCMRDGDRERPPRISWSGGEFGYRGCLDADRTQWFTLEGNTCHPAKATDAKGLRDRGRAALKAGDAAGAVALFDALVRAEPGIPEYLGERGYVRLKAGDQRGALGDLQRALALGPGRELEAQIHFNLGLTYEKAGQTAKARAAFERANVLKPSAAAKKKLEALK